MSNSKWMTLQKCHFILILWLLLTLFLLTFLTACSTKHADRKLIFDTTVFLDQKPLEVAVFTTREQQSLGLMGIEVLSKNTGALFVFEPATDVNFWMKSVLIKLDLLFFDEQGQLTGMVESAEPCGWFSCPQFPARNVRYVLEVNGGFVQDNQLPLNVRLRVP